MIINRGSEWKKWNFHVHTKGTNKNDQFSSSTMDEFFHTFFKSAYQNKINAIGITDYFSIDRYLDTIKYVSEIEKKTDVTTQAKLFNDAETDYIKNIYIFPNVELRISPTTKKGKFINLHFLFNPDKIDFLENEFFNKLSNIDGYLMNYKSINDYGKFLNPSLQEEQFYKYGIDNYNLEFGKIKNLLESNKFLRDNSLIAISSKSNDGVSGLKDYYAEFETEGGALLGTIKSIYKKSQIIFSNTDSDKEYFLGNKTSIDEVISHTGSLKPCVVGCDSHTETTLFNRFTWVKSELSFEGLRQICFEPEQRVKIQSEKPDFKEDKVIIDKVKFSSPNNIFCRDDIYLHPNLNVIIGGKSSGKSILLYSIAKTLLPEPSILKNDNNEEKYNLKSIDPNFNFEITTKAGISQKMDRDTEENSIIPDLKYIPQSYLVKLAEPELNKKGRPLNKLIRDLIKEDDEYKIKYDNFIKNVKQDDKDRQTLIDNYFDLIDNRKTIENDLKTKSNKTVLETNIASNLKKVEELNKAEGLDNEQLEKYKQIQDKQILFQQVTADWKTDYENTQNFLSQLNHFTDSLIETRNNIFENFKLSSIKEYYTDKLNVIDLLKNRLSELSKELIIETDGNKKYFSLENPFKYKLDELKREKEVLEKEIQPFQKNNEIQKQISLLNKSITDDKKLLNEIDILSKKLVDNSTLIINCYNSIFELYEKTYNEYENIIKELKDRTIELEKDRLKIDGIAQYNFPKLYKNLYEISDGRKASYRNYPDLIDEDKKATDESKFQEIKSQIEIIFNDIINDNYSLLQRIDKKHAIEVLLDDYFFDYWKITYKNDKLGEMSTGKASFVILMLIIGLSKSKSPILIDQPEDNLDNRSITKDLVYYLKNKKLERQIIVVTHNANIVVNSDAENIIIANQKGQNNIESTSIYKFDYINGAMENTFPINTNETDLLKSMGIREHIAEIVEGGKIAFKKREEKYRFNK